MPLHSPYPPGYSLEEGLRSTYDRALLCSCTSHANQALKERQPCGNVTAHRYENMRIERWRVMMLVLLVVNQLPNRARDGVQTMHAKLRYHSQVYATVYRSISRGLI